LVDYHIDSSRAEKLVSALCDGNINSDEDVSQILNPFHQSSPPGPLAESRMEIDECFDAHTMEDIFSKLQSGEQKWHRNTLSLLQTKSPTSLKVTLKQIQTAKSQSFDDAIKTDYRLVNRFIKGHDFYEGVRALLIDKDKTPDWQPNHIEAVSDDDVNAYFESLGAQELHFDKGS